MCRQVTGSAHGERVVLRAGCPSLQDDKGRNVISVTARLPICHLGKPTRKQREHAGLVAQKAEHQGVKLKRDT